MALNLKITRQVIHCKQWHPCTFYSHTILLSVSVQFYKVSYEQGAIDSFFLLVSMENRTDKLGSKKKPVVWVRHTTRQNYGAW